MKFGKKMGSMKALKSSLKKGGNTSGIRFIPKNDSMTVRFIQEPEEWVNYVEVFDPTIRRGYPLPDDTTAKGYDPDLRRSSRYLTNALDIDSDKVIALQLPKDLVNQLTVMAEKYGTICDRDYELIRSGEGLDTQYTTAPEPALPRKLDKYTPLDLEQALEDAYLYVWGDGDDDEEEAAAPRRPDPKRRPKSIPVDDEDDDTDDDDDVDVDDDEADEAEDDVDDDDTDDDDDEAADDDDVYTEEELRAMPIAELRAIAKEAGYATRGLKAPQIVDLLINGEEDDDEDEAF